MSNWGPLTRGSVILVECSLPSMNSGIMDSELHVSFFPIRSAPRAVFISIGPCVLKLADLLQVVSSSTSSCYQRLSVPAMPPPWNCRIGPARRASSVVRLRVYLACRIERLLDLTAEVRFFPVVLLHACMHARPAPRSCQLVNLAIEIRSEAAPCQLECRARVGLAPPVGCACSSASVSQLQLNVTGG
jgi:hypothetical protein